jgi:hypothetical protein
MFGKGHRMVTGCKIVIEDVTATVTTGINREASEAAINSALISAGCLIFVIVPCRRFGLIRVPSATRRTANNSNRTKANDHCQSGRDQAD